jgi:hypothetical protein
MLGAGVVAFAGVETRKASGGAMPSVVRSAIIGYNAGGVSSWDLTSLVDATGGNLLVVIIHSITTNSIDPDSVTYDGVSLTKYVHLYDSTSQSMWIYYLLNPAAGSNVVHVTASITANYTNGISANAFVISGANSSAPMGVNNIVLNPSGAASASITTTSPNNLILASVGLYYAPDPPTVTSGFTLDQSNIAGANEKSYAYHKGAAASGAVGFNVTPAYNGSGSLLVAVVP